MKSCNVVVVDLSPVVDSPTSFEQLELSLFILYIIRLDIHPVSGL